MSKLMWFVLAAVMFGTAAFSAVSGALSISVGYMAVGMLILIYCEIESLAKSAKHYIGMVMAKEALKAVGITEDSLTSAVKAIMAGKEVDVVQRGGNGEWRFTVDGKPMDDKQPPPPKDEA